MRLMHVAFNLILTATLLLSGVAAPAHAQAQTRPPVDVRFGAIEAWMAPTEAADLRVGWDRLLIDWHLYQPTSPEDWTPPPTDEQRVNEAVAAGREMVMLLRGTPPWATDGPPYASPPRGLLLNPDNPKNPWANFIRRLVKHYDGRVERFIIWNEPDIARDEYGAQFYGTIQEYFRMVKVAYLVAKETNPEVKIHLAGLTYWHDVVNGRRPFLQRYLELVSNDPAARENNFYFDVATLHIYFRTETVLELITLHKQILRDFDLDQPLWLNETNAAPADDPKVPWENAFFKLTMKDQSAFIVQSFALSLAAGVERAAVYKLAEINPIIPGADYNGLYRPDGSARPAVEAFRTITTHFAGMREATYVQRSSHYIVTITRDGWVTRVAWARGKQPASLRLTPSPGATSVTLYDDSGKRRVLAWDRDRNYKVTLPGAACADPNFGCVVSGAPLLIVEKIRTR
jgi:hypothetical protein